MGSVLIRYNNQLPGGVWVTLLGGERGKVYLSTIYEGVGFKVG